MKPAAVICFLFMMLHTLVYSQHPGKAILKLQGIVAGLNITSNGQLAVCTRVGEVAIAPSMNDAWQKIDIVKKDEYGYSSGLTLDNIDFFNKDTGFVSGFINNGDKYNIIYHTTTGGKTWKPIDFGMNGWVDIATHLDNGEAWLSVAGAGIAYTRDYGFTWTHYGIPENKQRFTCMYFNQARQGIIGSLWDMLAVTGDNCEHWAVLPTPLDQKKYNKTNVSARPEINKVAMFNNYYLVSQEGLVFYSLKDSINWVPLPAVTDFYTDAKNSALFFRTKKSGIIRSDARLQPAVVYDLVDAGYSARCKNGGLFVLAGEQVIHIGPDDSVHIAFQYSNEPVGNEPSVIGYSTAGAAYGVQGNKIFVQPGFRGKWQHVLDLPFRVDSGVVSLVADNRILYAKKDSLLYYNMVTKKLERTSLETRKANFLKSGIYKIIFEKGSSGCFHHYADQVVYERNNDDFETGGLVATGGKHNLKLRSDQHPIDAKLVDTFVQNLLTNTAGPTSISDLGFTAKDYEQCKIDIAAFKTAVEKNEKESKTTAFQLNENNIDFAKLMALADSIKSMPPGQLAPCLSGLSDLVSTTTNWVRVSLINNRQETLDITSYFYEPNAFYFPWQMKLDGSFSSSPDIRINRFLQMAYPGFLETRDKVEVLHTIVTHLYQNSFF